MSEASILQAEPGVLALSGVLDYGTGPALRQQGRALIGTAGTDGLVLDCSAVEKSSSVGVSLLLAYLRDAKAAGKRLQVRALPEDMCEIAQVCGLLELLPLEA
ncbi:STAS family protein [Azotobacter vinelandii CA]|uniref:STAS family protein n=2 Tax=Azotobacter vinelandii TaxID=354 RepID=C1DQ63_AZOVD|nr:STAS domain-containing protein [Azotobacter vinelandii]ACO77515.1 STAS family protein [Azotobacter vinelandii DJ]AGK15351.1 STAS family protein [Azotobacter vinelandii CA]AGK19846.1 STAS family protein [Azotobacter vinelandii CA6]WKN23299.1 STAS domain-containing protein [Azotobacter vinelandii]SFX48428.1 phospholipid transport system transporter-binding protein [Azotobacter vinelandii]